MMMRMRTRLWGLRLWGLGLAVALPAVALACSVPVFRYALDHWAPDAYQVWLVHDQDLGDDDVQRLRQLQRQIADLGANAEARSVDLREDLGPADAQRWEAWRSENPDAELPAVLVSMPGNGAIVGGGRWGDDEIEHLLASPLRTELAERLIAGEVIWVYLESGKPADDEVRYELLRAELDHQQETLELPEIDPDDADELAGDAEDLAIRFSAMRVSRDDPREHWLREMLLSTEPDLRDEEFADQAMVFPVFGRGRALYALVGDGINPDVIREAAIFLTGACQCTVKAENPGVDLLIPVKWDEHIRTPEPEAFDLPLIGLGDLAGDPSSTAGPRLADDLAAVEPGPDPADEPSRADSGAAGPDARVAALGSDVANGSDGANGNAREQETGAEIRPTGAATTAVPVSDAGGWLRWLPWGVLLAIGLIAILSGATLMRGQEGR